MMTSLILILSYLISPYLIFIWNTLKRSRQHSKEKEKDIQFLVRLLQSFLSPRTIRIPLYCSPLLSARCHYSLLSSLFSIPFYPVLFDNTLSFIFPLLSLFSSFFSFSSSLSFFSSPLFSPLFTKVNHPFLPESQPFTSDSDGKFAFIRQPNAMGVNVAVLGDHIAQPEPDYVCVHSFAVLCVTV